MTGKSENRQVALQKFLDSPDEKVIIFLRTHWIIPLFSSLTTLLIGIFAIFICAFIFFRISVPPLIFLAVELIISAIFLLSITKIVADWYFHFYFVSNKKILEIRYSPFFSHRTNGVLLKQVNITEIDDKKMGIIKDFLDFGDVTVTFDRPTHEDEFAFEDVPHPGEIASKLREHFSIQTNATPQIWYTPNRKERIWAAG